MTRTRICRRLDPGWIVVLALCLVAAWPFLSRSGLPRETDAELHVFRVAELARLMQQGELYPRWAADFYYGYGYPLFNFYGPLTYYLGAAIAALPGLDAVSGAKAVFVLGIALSGLGTYALARERWGAPGGALAAVAYIYTPYLLLFDPYLRGNMAECFTFGIIPWVLWAVGRLTDGGGRRYFIGAAVGWAALLITHNVMAMLLSVLLAAYALFQWLLWRERQAFGRSVLALALGLGLAAFYWLPVLTERQFVQNENIIQGYFDFHDHFLPLSELFGPAKIQDLGATFPDFRFNIGLGQVILVALVLLLLFYKYMIFKNTDERRQTQINHKKSMFIRVYLRPFLFWLIAALGLIFLMLPVSTRLWEAIPPLAYVQFPWKLLGPLALVVAMLAGGLPWLARRIGGERLSLAATGGGILLVLLTALPNTFPPAWNPDFGGATVLDHLRFERQGRAVGTTSAAEYLPLWVELQPGPAAWLTDAYEEGRPLNKLEPASLPAGAEVIEYTHTPATDRFVIESPQPFTVRVLTFYFPGWRAWVDGEPVEITPHEPSGFITVPLPAGRHSLELRFGSTLARTAGTAISFVSLAALLGVTLMFKSSVKNNPDLFLREWAPLLGLALLFFIAKIVVIDRQPDWFRITSTGLEARPAQHKLQINFADQVMLLGYDLPRTEIASDDEIPLTLYWKAVKPVPHNYAVFVHLVRPPEHTWGQDDRLNPADFPMTRWPPDKYVRDEHRLPVLPGTPPGEYEIEVGFYRQDTGERLLVLEGGGLAGSLRLPVKVHLLPPESLPTLESLGVQQRIEIPIGDDLFLLGWSLNADAFTPPNFAHLTLFWRAERDISADTAFILVLLDEGGGVVGKLRGPVDGFYPTSVWRRGEIVRDQYAFWLPKGMMAGRYHLELRVGSESLSLTEIRIEGEKG